MTSLIQACAHDDGGKWLKLVREGMAILWLCLANGLLPAGGVQAAGPADLTQLRRALAAALSQSTAPGAVWGLEVAQLTNGAAVFTSNSSRLFVPASCTKLFSTALVLDRLGAGYRIETALRAEGETDASGTLHGDLRWAGRGAPDLGERRTGSSALALAPYVDAVVRAGIRQVEGALVADESWFRTPPYGAGWSWDDLPEAYGAAVSGLSFNDNYARVLVQPGPAGLPALVRVEPDPETFRVLNRTQTGGAGVPRRLRFERLPGSVELLVAGTIPLGAAVQVESLAVPDPAWGAGRALEKALRQRGIAVRQGVRVLRGFDRINTDSIAERGRWLGAVTSAPLSELVRDCLKPSQNLHAQLLLLQVGAQIETRPRPGESIGESTDETALSALFRLLRSVGVTPNEYAFEEASGLSRKNVVTPAATVRLLRHMAMHPDIAVRKAWIAALPVAGVDGTLKTRLARARGRIQAKTGSLRQIHALAGYIDTLGGDRLAFALYLNGYVTADPKASGRAELDGIVEILAGFTGKL